MSDGEKKRPLRSYVSELSRGKRITRIIVRVTLEEKEHLEAAASREGLSLSSFIRRLLAVRIGSRWIKPGKSKAGNEEGDPPSSRRTE